MNKEELLSQLREIAVNYGLRFLTALVFFIVGIKIANAITKRVYKRQVSAKFDPAAVSFLRSFMTISLKTVIIVISVAILGVPMSTVTALVGTVSLAIGLALQGSLANFAGGFMILIFKPFGIGDYIDNHTDSGKVIGIGIFYTTLETFDKRRITIPNGQLSNATVINYSANNMRSQDIEIGIAPDADIDKAKDIIEKTAIENEKAFDVPKPTVSVSSISKLGTILLLRIYSSNEDRDSVRYAIIESVKKEFDKANILLK